MPTAMDDKANTGAVNRAQSFFIAASGDSHDRKSA
jgi:hypothetical protein